ncbi:hypothetical protein GCM10008927_03390 [Amylibacter ulvae]|uniref:DUF1153 domain-containing protein n=1 Tax=Paramylibacter ulvae TaxID=1651968 RepID=A0ABQ3CV60_9RHOB|nr:DUF1153 domain-containing protein [Amylibacter ulvae]GHA42251.1 hypothetical protein GCM10008927_03390 [Amylibacter ulvae]
MYVKKETGPIEVSLPDGSKLNRSDLPAKDIKRWVARLKLVIVQAVVHGLITEDEACDIYGLSDEELESWILLSEKDGSVALRATALKEYRQ